ncbi:MAG TPA: IPT/TIG domain-containing protein [Mycobacteriales bacterium]|nr:IPT/TIG domain-containing protein [Mycobacteriales bacterium]
MTGVAPALADTGGAGPTPANAPGLHYGLIKRACRAASPGTAACFAAQRVPTTAGTPGAEPYTVGSGYAVGPAGGFTPADLRTAYGLTSLPADAGTGQTVAVVDAYHDPNALADLNHFDDNYGLPAESSSTFAVLNQTGGTSVTAPSDTGGWSIEESLDVDAVRAICPNCKILLVEANSNSYSDLGAAVNAAVAAGADEVSNSYGGREDYAPTSFTAYNHPGVVITASTGDDGWYAWDHINLSRYSNQSDGHPEWPATTPDVVAVGGTSLTLNADATRNTEAVWNEDGPENTQWINYGAYGASGGGCSGNYTAQAWQSNVDGYSTTGCGGHRLAADVSALADPYTGFDIFDSYDYGGGAPGWATYGGTSLASPLVAAMWALAGGAQGVSYPSLSLYGHARAATTHLYDVTKGYDASTGVLAHGGNDWCDGDNQTTCASNTNTEYSTTNPNGRGGGMVACGFSSTGVTVSNDTQCRAVTGFDGPSGVGTPIGVTAFKAMKPTASFTAPTGASPGVPANFSGSATDPFPGGSISTYSWHWGDGSSDSTGASAAHTFSAAGTYTVKLTATDSYGQVGTVSHSVTVGTVIPAVTGLSPNYGPIGGGTVVTITGTGFTGATKVQFGTAGNATTFTVNSGTKITATAPAFSATGSVNIRVFTSAGESPVATADTYHYRYATPAISSVSPSSGPLGGGTVVTINGSGFLGATNVQFGPAGNATTFTVNSDTKITATAPAYTTRGTINIRVANPTFQSLVVAGDNYTYTST